MDLVSVTIEDFRSITSARKIQLSNMTSLVGPNNEGKSNILRAIVIGMNAILNHNQSVRVRRPQLMPRRRRRQFASTYDWFTDCPLRLQKREGHGSLITLEFELSPKEIDEFQVEIGSKLNGTLPITVIFSKDDLVLTIAKPGRGGKTLNQKRSRIASFISARVDIQYIPAVRTAESAHDIVTSLVERELSKVEGYAKYQQALADIAELQLPILAALSKNITETMRLFLPNIKSAKVAIEEEERSFALRRIASIMLDDGVETTLEAKGDGVQSLAALALMRHVSSSRENANKKIVIALEEPESHLHPSAIRQLRDVLVELSADYRVVLTTHNPLFTNRINAEQNVIIEKNRAYPAKSTIDVRRVLGVRLDDNLTSAEVILLVEGQEDRMALSAILSSRSPELKAALQTGRLALDILHGAGNLSHRARLHTDQICKVHAFLDDDTAGRAAFEQARAAKALDIGAINFSTFAGRPESELEDLYRFELVSAVVKSEVGTVWPEKDGDDAKRKWTDRLRVVLRRSGKPIDDGTIDAIKIKVARLAVEHGYEVLHPKKTGSIDSLIQSLIAKLR